MPPKRFCQLRSRVTRRGGKPKEEPLTLKESFYAAPAPCLSLSAPSTEAAKSRRLGSHLLYIRRCPISRTQHLNKTTTLVAKKRISRTHLAWPGLSSGGLLSCMWYHCSWRRDTFCLQSLHRRGDQHSSAHQEQGCAKVAIVSPPELKMTNQV